MTNKIRKALICALTAIGLILAVIAAVFLSACADDGGSITLTFKNGDAVYATRNGDPGERVSAVKDPEGEEGKVFSGWTLEGSTAIVPVPAVFPEENMTFTAHFGGTISGDFKDLIGGDDVITVSGDTATLKRELFADVDGFINKSTGYFSFEISSTFTLEGKIDSTLGGFYYYKDVVGTSYNGQFEEDKIEFTGANTAAYTVGGKTVNGIFTIDPISGDFSFSSATTGFDFRIDKAAGTFDKASGEERGYYVLEMENGYEFLLLDGFPLYTLGTDGKPKYTKNSGTATSYNYNPDTGRFLTRLSANYCIDRGVIQYEQYTIGYGGDSTTSCRITREDKAYFGYKVRGNFVTADMYAGDFFDYQNIQTATTPDLSIDGYGRARYGTMRGTYTEANDKEYQMYTSNGISVYRDAIIEFKPDNGSSPILFRLEDTSYGLAYYVLTRQPVLVPFENSCSEVYGTVADTFYNFAMYFRNDQLIYTDKTTQEQTTYYEADVWSYIDDTEYGRVYEYLDYGYYIELGGGEYRYVSQRYSQQATNESFLFTFDFKYGTNGDTLISGITFMTGDETIAENGDCKIVSDKYGTLTYTDKKNGDKTYTLEKSQYGYATEFTTGSFAIYELDLGSDGGAIVMLDGYSEKDYKYHTSSFIPYENYSELVYKTSLAQREYDKMLLIKDAEASDYTRAFIKISYYDYSNPSEEMYSWLAGTLAKDGDNYTFTLTDPNHDIANSFDEDGNFVYSSFKFKIIDGKYVHYDGLNKTYTISGGAGGTLTLDGYGKGTLQSGSTSGNITYEINEELVTVTTEAGDISYYRINKDSSTAQLADEEGGIYIYAYFDGYLYYNNALILYGDADSETGTAIRAGKQGTYEATGRKLKNINPFTLGNIQEGVADEWVEYKLTFHVADSEGGDEEQIIYIALARKFSVQRYNEEIQDYEDYTICAYVEKRYDAGDFNIVAPDGNGGIAKEDGEVVITATLKGDGYNNAIYLSSDNQTLYEGTIDRGRFLNESSYPNGNFEYDPEGDTLYYTYLFEGDEYSMVLFDKQIDGGQEYWVERPLLPGTFLSHENGTVNEKEYITLDGYGNATLHKADSTTVEGKYSLISDDGDYNYRFVAKTGGTTFTFMTGFVQLNNDYRYVFIKHEKDTVFTNEYNEVLSLDVRGTATYIDRYGVRYDGEFNYVTDKLIRFQEVYGTTYGEIKVFDVTATTKTFNLNTQDFVVEDGVLLAYQGPTIVYGEFKIPDGVKELAPYVFRGLMGIRSIQGDKDHPSITASLNLNEVEKIGDHAFYNMTDFYVQRLVSDRVTEIGDYAFYSSAYDEYFSAINYIDMPNLTKIGDYAFYGCNQLNLDSASVKLKNIKSIGEYAFAHNTFNDFDPMKLDLSQMTAAQINELTIAETAFINVRSGWGDKYVAIEIYVSGEEAKTAIIAKLPKDFKQDDTHQIYVGAPTFSSAED